MTNRKLLWQLRHVFLGVWVAVMCFVATRETLQALDTQAGIEYLLNTVRK